MVMAMVMVVVMMTTSTPIGETRIESNPEPYLRVEAHGQGLRLGLGRPWGSAEEPQEVSGTAVQKTTRVVAGVRQGNLLVLGGATESKVAGVQ